MPKFTPRDFYDELVRQMEPGIDRAVVRVLSYHIGLENAIAKPVLLREVRALGFGKELKATSLERAIRDTIADLRNAGHLIGSSSGEGGYFFCATMDEYREFADREYWSKVKIMAEIARNMDAAAERQWPDPQQTSLF